MYNSDNDDYQKLYNQYRPKNRSPGTTPSSYYSTYSSTDRFNMDQRSDIVTESEYATTVNR